MNTPKTLLAVAVAACGLVWAGGTAQAQTYKGDTALRLSAQRKVQRLVDDGDKLAAAGDHKGAIEKYDAAVELDPKFTPGWVKKAYSHNERKEYDDAKDAAEEAALLDSLNAKAWTELGYAEWKLGDRKEAKANLYMAILCDSAAPDAYTYLIKVLEEEVANKVPGARKELREVKQMKEDAETAKKDADNYPFKTKRED